MTDIRAIRRGLGLSQEELAARLGLNQSTISRFETGELALDERTRLAIDAISMRLAADPAAVPPPPILAAPAVCSECDLRADAPQVRGCKRTTCPLAQRKAA